MALRAGIVTDRHVQKLLNSLYYRHFLPLLPIAVGAALPEEVCRLQGRVGVACALARKRHSTHF
ncbi:MAG: hypothetical protein CUN55_19025 [Phototrophicales bacterium]|nr:MAG: hypothetical protein CUN55_19025 [Phototrophicales bacterium]